MAVIGYNIDMDTPRNITELKTQVRNHLVSNRQRRSIIRELANVGDDPDLFGWLRLWVVTQQERGVNVDEIIDAVLNG